MSERDAPLKSIAWFPARKAAAPKSGAGATLAKLAVGILVGALLFLAHRATAAIVVWSIAGAVSLISLSSRVAKNAIDRAFAGLGRIIGTAIGTVLLTLVYALVITPTRFFRRITGADDLHLRDGGRQSFWLQCDDDQRKVRYVGSMFATEARATTSHSIRTLILAVIALFIVSEGILRAYGFGRPLLYVADPEIGYYPQPDVEIVRYGGRMHTNHYGMRSPDVAKAKPPGVFRILMLGDSTLFGGSYIDQEDLYASRVRVALNKSGVRGEVEVLAMGVNGWGPFHERGYVHRFGAFDADLVMIQMPIDDVVRPLYGLASVPFMPVQAPPRLAWEEVASHLMWRYRSEHEGHDVEWEKIQSAVGIPEYGRLVDDLQRAGSEVMVFVLPSREAALGADESLVDEGWREGLRATVASRGVTLYHPRGFCAGKGTADALYHDHVHLNPPGHRIYAEYIESKVEEDSARFRAWAAKP